MARKIGSVALFRVNKMTLAEDATVPISKIPEMVRRIGRIKEKYKVPVYLLAHAGDGNMHPTFGYDPANADETQRVEKAIRELFTASIELGGTLTGEHGIGLLKKGFLPLEVTEAEQQTWRNIKKSFDPEGILNPGKFV